MSFPVRPAGGSLVWRACDGTFAARFDYGANSARGAAVDQTRSLVLGGLPAVAGTVPIAAFEVTGLSVAPSVAYAAPRPDRSLIASPAIARGSAYEIVGYLRDPRGATRIVYQSAVYTAVAPRVLAVASPLAGVQLQRAADITFVLLELPAANTPILSLSKGILSPSKGDKLRVMSEPDVNLYVSDAKNGVSNGTVDEILAGGSSQKVLGTGFADPGGIAVDGAGNVYVAEKVSRTVAEIPAAGGPALSLGNTTVEPTNVAVDGAGNVFVADGSTVQKIPAGGGTPVTVSSGFSGPTGIALDAAGNLYVADTFNNAVKKVPAGSSTAVTLGSGFSIPMGVAVDGAGDVYVTDAGNKAVKEIAGNSVITLASGIAGLGQIALDTAGNVYVTASVGGANGVFEIPHGSHVPVAIGSGFTAPAGVAVKPAATPALTLTKTDNGPWRPGVNTTPPEYTIAVGNAGTAATTGTITVTDTLPAGLTLTAKPSAQSGTSWTCAGAAGATSFACTSTTPLAARNGSNPSAAVPIVVPVTIGATTKLGSKSITNTAHAFGGGDPVHATASSAVKAADSTSVELEPDVNLYASDTVSGAITEILAGGSSQKVLGSGFTDPRGIALDGAGNVYVAILNANKVEELPAGGGSTISLGTTFNEPTDVAVDGSGDVYVANFNGGTVQKIPAGGGAPVTVASGFAGPNGIALDAKGNLYVADTYHNAVKELPAGGGPAKTLGSGFSQPNGVAVDGSGNVYVTDSQHGAVKEIEGNKVVTLASGFSRLNEIAVDTAGNVYVAASTNGGATTGDFEIPAGSTETVAVGSGLTAAWGVAVKPAATPALTLAKTDNGPWRPGTNATPPKYTIVVGNAGTAATTGTITVTDTLPAGLTLSATPTAQSGTSWACTGAAGATSFTCTSTTSLAARAGAKPSSAVPIVVPVAIEATTKLGPKSITNTAHAFGGGDPLHATSTSALSATDSTTVELEPDVNLYVSDEGNGVVDEIIAGGGSQTTLGSAPNDVRGIALDGAGNVYVAELRSNTVAEIPAAGGSAVTLGTTFNEPTSVAVDGAGDVYVSNFSGGNVQKIPAGGGTAVTVASGFAGPNGIALDAKGNLYVADTFNNAVKRIPAGGGSAVTLGSGFSQPNGVAVDGAGNVYVTDSGHSAVKEIEGSSVVTVASGFTRLQQIAVDSAGNVYVADSQTGAFEIPAGSHVPIAVGSGFSAPWGVAVKPAATPALTLRKTDNGPWRPGTNATPPQYTIAVGNAGTAATTGTITVNDSLPAGLTLSATPSAQSGTSWTCTGAAGATSFTCTSTTPVAARAGAKPSSAVPIVVPVAIGATTKLGPKSITNTAHAFGGGDPLHATSTSALSATDSTTVELEPDVNLYVSDNGSGKVEEILAGGGSQKVLGSAFTPGDETLDGIAVDGGGNVYVAANSPDLGSGTVMEIPAGGGTPISLGSFSEANDVAVDGAGNVYVADITSDGTVQKVPAGGGTPVTIFEGSGGPLGIALDATGNLYVADALNNVVKEVPAGGGPVKTLGSGFSQPNDVAVDGAGNVYVTDSGHTTVKEIKGSTVLTLAKGFSSLGYIAVDTGGNVYVSGAVSGANGVFEIPAGSTVPVSVGSGFSSPFGVAVKPAAAPALTLSKTDNGPWRPGANATPPKYTIAVGNAGTAATTGTITVTDTLPAGLSLSATPSAQSGTSWTCTGAAGATSFTCTSTTSLAARAGAKPSSAVPIVVPVAIGATTKLGPKSITNTAHAFGGGDPLHATSTSALSATDSTTVELQPDVNIYVSDEGNGVVDKIIAGGTSQPTLGSGFNDVRGIAVDGYGSVFLAEVGNNSVAEIPAAGGSAITLGTTFKEPTSVAVDGAGDVYVSNFNGGTVQKIPAGGGTPVTVASGFAGPNGIALDAAGNLYVADTFNNAVKKFSPGSSTAVTLGSGFSQPNGVAVDGTGNVYVTDSGNGAVKEIEGSSVVTLASGFGILQQIAVDGAGNVYVCDSSAGAFEIPAGSHVPIAVGSGFGAAWGVAVKPAATPALTLAKTDNGPWRPGVSATPPEYTIAVGNAGTAATTGTITVTDTLPTGLTLTATPSAKSGTSWACTGAAGATSFTCTSTTPVAARAGATPGSTVPIVVPVTVGPATKIGTESITNTAHAFGGGDPAHATSSNAASATDATTVEPELEPDVNLYVCDEMGSIDEILAGGSSQSTLSSAFADPRSIAVDGAGNVYVPDAYSGTVTELPAAGSAQTLASGLMKPTSVAVDGTGNVYVANFKSGTIQKIPAGGGTPVTFASGFAGPNGIALDAAGNLYVADTGNDAIRKIPVGGGTPVTLGSGFSGPNGVAVDRAGNVYVSDSGNAAVKEIRGSTVLTVASRLGALEQIAVDGADNVYIADGMDSPGEPGGVFEIPAGSSVPVSIGSGFGNAWGVAVLPDFK
jgi:uncharacterized repeat protein (TIGR01451 family)